MKSFPSEILESIRQHLEEEQARVETRLRELAAQDPFSDPDRVIDNAASDTEASEESTHDRFNALGDELKNQQLEIREALERVKNGTYGFCTQCGSMIDTDRLGVLPTARLCRTCEGKKKIRA